MSAGDELPLRLITYLQDALSHSIRTPLSIISNDLQFLKVESKDPEIDRSLDQCRKITQILSASSLKAMPRQKSERISLVDIFRQKGIKIPEDAAPISFMGNRESLIFAVKELLCFASWQEIDINSAPAAIVLTAAVENQLGQGEFNLLSEAFNGILGKDMVQVPLIDAIFLYHGISVAGTIKGPVITVELKLPNE